MLIGYARVSTRDQGTRMQIDALRRAGCTVIFEEQASSVGERHELQRCLASLVAGDLLVVYKIDRIARSLFDLLAIIDRMKSMGAEIRSLNEPLDTSTPLGVFMLQMLGAVAQLERSMIRERSMAGQIAAIERGVRWGGRPPLLDLADRLEVQRCYASGWWTAEQLAIAFGVSRTTIQRVLGKVPMSYPRKRMPVLGQFLREPVE